MEIGEFQGIIRDCYGERDAARGTAAALAWLVEEIGELSRALRTGGRQEALEEFADVLAWLASLADLCGISLEEAAGRYAGGCPKCRRSPCRCPGGPPGFADGRTVL
jgi:NTP pyrophosphatase (non-canonical NTP hydrolase)